MTEQEVYKPREFRGHPHTYMFACEGCGGIKVINHEQYAREKWDCQHCPHETTWDQLIFNEQELPQGSDEWKAWRKAQGIGASSVAALVFETPYSTILSEWELRTGVRPPKVYSAAMQQGNNKEQEAREFYESLYGKVEPLCVVHSEHHWMYCSFDGVRLDRSAVLEIKCPKDLRNHSLQTSKGTVPRHRRAQLQHQLAIAESHWGTRMAHYFSYVDKDNYKLIEVPYNEEYTNELIRRERIFLFDYVRKGVPPPKNLFREKQKGIIARPTPE